MIARLNMGGPAHQAALLSGRRFFPERYETRLVHGLLAPGEGSLVGEAEREGAQMTHLRRIGQPVKPVTDARALTDLSRIVREFRPEIIHSHTAKAGMLARTAAMFAPGPRPILVHTFHGHVLEGYFGSAKSAAFTRIERVLAKRTDALIGVSQATVDDLIRLGVAEPSRFRVVPLGLALEQFSAIDPGMRAGARAKLAISESDVLCTFVGRIVPIKRVDLLLEALSLAHARDDRVKLLVVGDGESRPELERQAARLGIAAAVSFVGYRSDLAALWAASDIAVLSSANEGTPVSLIEAGAAAVPAVATDVGGVRETVSPEASVIAAPGNAEALAEGILSFAGDANRRKHAGRVAREFALSRFDASQLINRIDGLYGELLDARGATR